MIYQITFSLNFVIFETQANRPRLLCQLPVQEESDTNPHKYLTYLSC
ncbi:MAG: hypothetical protein ACJAYB_000391 [Psychromonas sp.]|jgi:hypothetical protein